MNPGGPHSVEMPSGKDAAYENFPVGSFLLPARTRPHVAVFYAFARAIDDVADSPALPPDEKIRRLDGFEAAVLGRGEVPAAYAKGTAMRDSLSETGVAADHCVELIAAFKQDATKGRYRDWDDLMGYCRLSAAPVGRYLLDLHGGARDGYGPSDALCMALQVINHLQDCQDDYRTLDRVYLPLEWMEASGARIEDLDGTATPPALRAVFDRMLDATEALLRDAARLPRGLANRRLAMEAGAILTIARTLCQRLRRGDPVAGRVALSKADYIRCCARGAMAAMV